MYPSQVIGPNFAEVIVHSFPVFPVVDKEKAGNDQKSEYKEK